jgi:hypothetical protein
VQHLQQILHLAGHERESIWTTSLTPVRDARGTVRGVLLSAHDMTEEHLAQLRLIRDRNLICEVSDASNTAPHLRRARTYDEGGRGLLLVAQLTQGWGTRQTYTGKTIWAEQAL